MDRTETPWEIEDPKTGTLRIVHWRTHPETGTPQPQLIATVANRTGETKGNAALLVAAPEMAKAIEDVYRAIVLGNGRKIDWNAIADGLRAILARLDKE